AYAGTASSARARGGALIYRPRAGARRGDSDHAPGAATAFQAAWFLSGWAREGLSKQAARDRARSASALGQGVTAIIQGEVFPCAGGGGEYARHRSCRLSGMSSREAAKLSSPSPSRFLRMCRPAHFL